jgi:hypothetical protein
MWVEIMGAGKYESVGKSQPVLIVITPVVFPRAAPPAPLPAGFQGGGVPVPSCRKSRDDSCCGGCIISALQVTRAESLA